MNRYIFRIVSLWIVACAITACSSGSSGGGRPPATYSIGGTITGLIGSIVLQNNGGGNLTINGDGAFSFAAELENNANYAVSVLTQPAGQSCAVGQAAGSVTSSDVTSVSVQCRPVEPVLAINGQELRLLNFTWGDVTGETEYRLMEDLTGSSGFSLRGNLAADSEQAAIEIFVPDYADALYMLQACDSSGCVDSNIVAASDALNDAIGYAKALVPDPEDRFGTFVTSVGTPSTTGLSSIALSADGTTLVIGASGDDSGGTGIGNDAADNSAPDSGSAYVLNRVGPGTWVLQAYIKASNAEAGDTFGAAVALSSDGNTLAVSALGEDGSVAGVNGNQSDNLAADSGATYVFVRDNTGTWSQQAYMKASNVEADDSFGLALDMSGDGLTVVVGSPQEDSVAAGINGNQSDNSLPSSGAAYVFTQDGIGNWSQHSYVKSSNPDPNDLFGWKVAIDGAGDTLVVSGKDEDSASTGVNGNQLDNTLSSAGAVYVFDLDVADSWSQQAYVKASNTGEIDIFGWGLALSNDGLTLAVGAPNESSAASGIDGAQFDDSSQFSGAVYLYTDDGVGNWTQQAYIKASNTNGGDIFGVSLDLSGDGSSLVVGAYLEDSDALGINGDQFNELASASGAVYLFNRDVAGLWSQKSYIKSPNSEAGDTFGTGLGLSGDGRTLAVSAPGEDSASPSGGDRTDNSAANAGAVFVY